MPYTDHSHILVCTLAHLRNVQELTAEGLGQSTNPCSQGVVTISRSNQIGIGIYILQLDQYHDVLSNTMEIPITLEEIFIWITSPCDSMVELQICMPHIVSEINIIPRPYPGDTSGRQGSHRNNVGPGGHNFVPVLQGLM